LGKFGSYDLLEKIDIDFEGEHLLVEKVEDDTYLYERCRDEKTISKRNFSSKGNSKLSIYPVRPIQVPKLIAHNVMIKLNPPLSIGPNSSVTQRITMPIEIGVFLSNSKKNYMIDVFELSKPKYALYGIPNSGYICRSYESSLTENKEEPYKSAIVIMKFENKFTDWVTVNKIVMDAYTIDLYLKDDTVYLEDSQMTITNRSTASIKLNNKPPIPGLKAVPMAEEVVKKFRLGLLGKTGFGVEGIFQMEHGF
jgi:hypothetical protein